MASNFDMDFEDSFITLKIVGVGGGGGNAINRMVESLNNTNSEQNTSSGDEEENNNCRFSDNDELKYSLRSVQMFASWINKIFIVTDGQVPDWLNTKSSKIKTIYR